MDFLRISDKVWKDEYLTNEEFYLLLHWVLSGEGKDEFENNIAERWDSFRNERSYDYEETLRKINAQRSLPSQPRRKIYRLWWAAAVAILVIAGVKIIQHNIAPTNQFAIYDGVFGSPNKAVITLSDGTTIAIDDITGDHISDDGASAKVKKGLLEYDPQEQSGRDIFHEIFVPAGSEYKLALSDGTTIWLNSETRIKYPVSFPEDERRVHLITGEAYLEISSDTLRPFTLESPGQFVTVLGTRFNISAYDNVYTTLAEGRVRVTTTAGDEIIELSPGEQALLDRITGNISVRAVDVHEILAWKDGYIVIGDQSLQGVMQSISRWYGVGYTIGPDVPQNFVFSGIIPKYNIEETLGKLGLIADLNIYLDGNMVYVEN